MEVLLFAGSLRKASLNKKLAQAASSLVSSQPGFTSTLVDLKDLSIPLYDGDIESVGIPEGVTRLAEAVRRVSAIVIASPEYNHSMSSPLKNTIDWLSRLKPGPLADKPVLMLGASPGAFGAIRGMTHARQPLTAVGALIFPRDFALPKADQAFNEAGELADAGVKERLSALVRDFLGYAGKVAAR